MFGELKSRAFGNCKPYVCTFCLFVIKKLPKRNTKFEKQREFCFSYATIIAMRAKNLRRRGILNASIIKSGKREIAYK